ncbi:MAG: cell division protein ZapA [Lachnospiraceae bacterium]|nr:cell division protein ZapA [Lachnospiraceae bacterium]
MSSKNTVTVVINGKITRLTGYESEEYLQKVSAYLSNKMKEFSDQRAYSHMTSDMRSQMLALNIADDYFKAKTQADLYDEELRRKEEEIMELRQEIADLEAKYDAVLTANYNEQYSDGQKKRR